jgi:hypothetical protein
MNEQRITDHAEHCDFYVGNEHYDKSYEEQQRLWTLKFAELIIEECARICDVVRENEGGDRQFGARLCADEIRYLNRGS